MAAMAKGFYLKSGFEEMVQRNDFFLIDPAKAAIEEAFYLGIWVWKEDELVWSEMESSIFHKIFYFSMISNVAFFIIFF